MPDSARETFARNLSYILNSTGKSQIDVARALDVATGTVSSWVNGQKFPRIDTLQQLADFLGVRMAVLTEDNGITVFTEEAAERRLLSAWRAADDRAREDALKTLLDHPRKKETLMAE